MKKAINHEKKKKKYNKNVLSSHEFLQALFLGQMLYKVKLSADFWCKFVIIKLASCFKGEGNQW